MNNNRKISVLITFYNQEKYVDRALESVLSQKTNFKFKVIVGDDGSTDGTMAKLEAWKVRFPDKISIITQKRIKDKKYIAGSRASQNRLALIKKVDTPYFIFLDGDDYWIDDNKLQIQHDILEDEKNADCIASAHQMIVKREGCDEVIEYLPQIKQEKKFTLREYWSGYYFSTDTILFRSNYIDNLPYNILNEAFNDNMITYAFLQYGKIHYIPRAMAVYWQNNQGIWAGEKLSICMIRNIMLYDIEMMINGELKYINKIRHLGDFIYFHKNKMSIENIDSQYLEIAQKYSLKTMENILLGKPMLSSNYYLDTLMIVFLRVIRKFNSILPKILG